VNHYHHGGHAAVARRHQLLARPGRGVLGGRRPQGTVGRPARPR